MLDDTPSRCIRLDTVQKWYSYYISDAYSKPTVTETRFTYPGH